MLNKLIVKGAHAVNVISTITVPHSRNRKKTDAQDVILRMVDAVDAISDFE